MDTETMVSKLDRYIRQFNEEDTELYRQAIPNSQAAEFLAGQIPLLECP